MSDEDAVPSPETQGAPMQPFVVLDANDVVVAVGLSNADQSGGVVVDVALAADARSRLGACRLVQGALVDYAPPSVPDPVPVAVSKLGLVRALIASGQWAAVWAELNADPLVLAQWNAASQIALADPLTQALIASMALTDDQVTALMRAAMSST